MSQRLIARNPLLKRLRDEGYNVQAPDGYLVVRDVPYVNRARAIARGILMMPLDLANDIVQPPTDHQAQFSGDVPCNADGTEIFGLAPSASAARAGDVTAKVNFSAKPLGTGKYKDIYHKVTSYLQRITEPVAGAARCRARARGTFSLALRPARGRQVAGEGRDSRDRAAVRDRHLAIGSGRHRDHGRLRVGA